MEEISCIRYSPDGLSLAVGSKDNYIYVSASIRQIDFSEDGKWLMSNCAGREILYWNAETGKQDRDALGKRDIAWE